VDDDERLIEILKGVLDEHEPSGDEARQLYEELLRLSSEALKRHEHEVAHLTEQLDSEKRERRHMMWTSFFAPVVAVIAAGWLFARPLDWKDWLGLVLLGLIFGPILMLAGYGVAMLAMRGGDLRQSRREYKEHRQWRIEQGMPPDTPSPLELRRQHPLDDEGDKS
jgi:hypothetical protein